MCSTSKVNDALGGLSATAGVAPLSFIPAHKVQQNRSRYSLVDVREAKEIKEHPMDDPDYRKTLGDICHDASELLVAAVTNNNSEKTTIVLVCNTGKRAEIAASAILAQHPSAKVAVLQRGLVGWNNPSAVSPDFMVVLGVSGAAMTEKLSLGLAALASAVDLHETVALVLMSDGVQWFINPDSTTTTAVDIRKTTPNVETVSHGDPFKPCQAMLKKFLSNGGIILACTTCVKHRQLSFENGDMMDCVNPMQMPDLVRMLGEAKGGSLQFL